MKLPANIINFFVYHKVAANLLLGIILLCGTYATQHLNVLYFPDFKLSLIKVTTDWRGASADDVQTGITIPLEQTLKNVDHLRHIDAKSSPGHSEILLEIEEEANTLNALDQIKQKTDEFDHLPKAAKKPSINRITHYEQITRFVIYGTQDIIELKNLARRFEKELLEKGIEKVDINGIPDQEISIEIPSQTLQHLNLDLNSVSQRILELSKDIPAGLYGSSDSVTELRALDQQRDEIGFEKLPIISDQQSLIRLGDIASVSRRFVENGITLTVAGAPAIEFTLRRAEKGDAFASAHLFKEWLGQARATIPPGITIHVYDESWKIIKDRVLLLTKNGISGLLLVSVFLYFFLNYRVAWWVAAGIPAAFMASFWILYLAGGSINMISLFAFIMALGIVVDDAIVVGEDALVHFHQSEEPISAAAGGANRMLGPVMAASLTTIAAFIPLMALSGPTGKILFSIPLVIIAAIIASSIECFLILPAHLKQAFTNMQRDFSPPWQIRLEKAFNHFKNGRFKKMTEFSLNNRLIVLSLVFFLVMLTTGLIVSQRIQFRFFVSPDNPILYVKAGLVPGTPKATMDSFLEQIELALYKTDRQIPDSHVVKTAIAQHGVIMTPEGRNESESEHFGSMIVELIDPDKRSISNLDFINAWKSNIPLPPGIDFFSISTRNTGITGRELTIRLTGSDSHRLKDAAALLAVSMQSIAGVTDVSDNMPYGRNQRVLELSPLGKSLGLTADEVGNQLRNAYDGKLIQVFQDGSDEVSVRLKLPKAERDSLSAIENFDILLPSGNYAPLIDVGQWRIQRGFEILRRSSGSLAVEVSADVDNRVNNASSISDAMAKDILPKLAARYGIGYSFEGPAADERKMIAEMSQGFFLALILMYLILCWFFSSYGWPLIIMATLPLGLIGALLGHFFLGLDVTILSVFGFFGLSGIVANDAIILVSFYQSMREQKLSIKEALSHSVSQRLRAILLTSLTTVAGLTPLLFESSTQAQFLIPMAVSIVFGLLFSSVLVLFFIPSVLIYYEELFSEKRLTLS